MAEVALRSSEIADLGVFAVEAVASGEVIRELEIEREVTADDPLRPERGERPEYASLIDGRFLLIGTPDRYLNHSCDPNAYLRFGIEAIQVVARREIAAGAELTLDYLISNPGGESWPCRCGAARCRGETGKSFFTLPEPFRREYASLLAPWFLERYAERLEHLTREPSGRAVPRASDGEARRTRVEYRRATRADAEAVAELHARSWRESYRGSFSDSFLDGDLPGERLRVWSERLAAPRPDQFVQLAIDGTGLVGFVCAYGGQDPRWGSFVDNLHVAAGSKRRGVGSALMRHAGAWLGSRYADLGVFLWVLEANGPARRFYERLGGRNAGTVRMETHGGTVVRSCRYTWRRAELLANA